MATKLPQTTLVITLLILLMFKCTQGQKCDANSLKKFDADVARLVTIGNSGRKFPEDKQGQLKKFCVESEELIKGLEQTKDCFDNLAKQLFGVIIYSIKNTIRQYCRRDSKKLTEIIAATPCMNKHNGPATKCYTKFIDSILGSQNAENKKKIPHLCCEYAKIFPCFEKVLTTRDKCNEKHVQSINDFIRSLISNAVDLICGEYTEGSDKCESVGPVPKKKKSQRRPKSFALPILDLISSVPE